MLHFNSNNIYSYNHGLSDTQIGLNAMDTLLLPFQMEREYFVGIDDEITSWKLINGEREISLNSDIAKIDIVEDAGNGLHYIFNGDETLLTSISFGIWQMYFEFADGRDFYSNFFTVINEYNAILIYYNSFDFDGRIYQYGYKNILYIKNKIVSDTPFKIEKVYERGNGTKNYEYQNFAESYLFSIFGDEFMNNELGKISLFDKVFFTWKQYENVQIFGRAKFDFSFDATNLNYKGILKFSINEVDKTLCESNSSYTPVGSTILELTTDDGTTAITTDDGTTILKSN